MATTPRFAKAQITQVKQELDCIVGGTIKEVDATYIDMNVHSYVVISAKDKEYMLQAVGTQDGPGTFLLKEV